MKRPIAGLALTATLTLLAAPASLAQLGVADSIQPLSQIYRLDQGSFFSEGCLPPCLCPIWLNGDMRGTFALKLTGATQFTRTYAVEDVNWTVEKFDGSELRVIGKGVYTQYLPGVLTVLPTHRMVLELSVAGAKPAKFDSGQITDPGVFPKFDIALADNDFYCYNRVFNILASPVSPKEIEHYAIKEGTYHEGCYPPCKCALAGPMKVVGSFDLVPLENLGTVEQYAVVNADWQVWNYFGAKSISVRGFGNFTRISGVAGWWSRMELDLSMGGAPYEHFDSGGANETEPFPTILTELSINGKYCYDKVFKILAKPVKYVALPMLGG